MFVFLTVSPVWLDSFVAVNSVIPVKFKTPFWGYKANQFHIKALVCEAAAENQ